MWRLPDVPRREDRAVRPRGRAQHHPARHRPGWLHLQLQQPSSRYGKEGNSKLSLALVIRHPSVWCRLQHQVLNITRLFHNRVLKVSKPCSTEMIIYNFRYNCDKIHATENNSIIFYANRKFVATVKYTILWTAIVKKPGAISNEGRIAMIFVRVCLTLLAPLHFELSRILSLEMFVVIGVNTSRFVAQCWTMSLPILSNACLLCLQTSRLDIMVKSKWKVPMYQETRRGCSSSLRPWRSSCPPATCPGCGLSTVKSLGILESRE